MNWFTRLFINKRRNNTSDITQKEAIDPPIQGYHISTPYRIPLKTTTDYINAIKLVPQFYAVLRISSDNYSRGKYKLHRVQRNGKRVELFDHELLKKLKKPNPTQTGREFIQQKYIFLQAAGNSYMFANVPRNVLKIEGVNARNIQTLWALPSQYVYIESGDTFLYNATEINEIIKNYVLMYRGATRFEPESIMHLNQPSIDFNNTQGIVGDSATESLEKAFSNIVLAYNARNIGLKEGRPAMGASPKNPSGDQLNPMKPEQIKAENDRFENYGTQPGMYRLWYATREFNFQKIGYTLKDMEIPQGIEEESATICNQYGVPFELLKKMNSKYSDKKLAQQALFNNKLIPESELEMEEMNNFFQLADERLELTYSFDHLPELQTDRRTYAEVNAVNTKSISTILKDFNDGIATYDATIQRLKDVTNKPDDEVALYLPQQPQPTGTEEAQKEDYSSVFKDYRSAVNMTYTELAKWYKGINGRKKTDGVPIERNLHLLSTPKSKWGEQEFKWANETIQVIKEKKDQELRNWAFDETKVKQS